MIHGTLGSPRGRITIKDSRVLKQGNVICNRNYKPFDKKKKKSWHASSGESVPDDGRAKDSHTDQSS